MEGLDSLAPTVRAPTVDGIFYPCEPEILSARIDALLAEASPGPAGQAAYALIVPHAALDLAGEVAAAAYRSAAGRSPRIAVLLGPMHRDVPDAVGAPESLCFQTPLGCVPVDQLLLQRLQAPPEARPCFRTDELPHLEEHCLEVQLPFLQRLFPSLRIVPLLVGRLSPQRVQLLGQRLWETFSGQRADTLFVATANLSGPPAGTRFLRRVLASDWHGIAREAGQRKPGSCGNGAVAAILHLHGRRGGPVPVLRQAGATIFAR